MLPRFWCKITYFLTRKLQIAEILQTQGEICILTYVILFNTFMYVKLRQISKGNPSKFNLPNAFVGGEQVNTRFRKKSILSHI